jgi:adenine-specific DNA-methyltransferase
MTNPGDLVFDPFSGVGSSGVAAAIHKRKYWGAELNAEYTKTALKRIDEGFEGKAKYRAHDKPLYDHTRSNLSKAPKEWLKQKDS